MSYHFNLQEVRPKFCHLVYKTGHSRQRVGGEKFQIPRFCILDTLWGVLQWMYTFRSFSFAKNMILVVSKFEVLQNDLQCIQFYYVKLQISLTYFTPSMQSYPLKHKMKFQQKGINLTKMLVICVAMCRKFFNFEKSKMQFSKR